MELKAVVGSVAASAVFQVKTIRKIHSLELAKVRKIEMERQEEARKAHRESVRAEIEKRKKEKEEEKKKEQEKKVQEERKLLKEINQLSKDLKSLSKEIKKSGKVVVNKSTKLVKIEAIEPLIEAIEPPIETVIVHPIVTPPIFPPSPIFEGSSANSKIITTDYLMTGTNQPYQSRPEISLIPRLTKKRDLLRGKGSDSDPDPDRESESESPIGVLERAAEFGSGLFGLEIDDDDLSTCGSVPVLVEL